MAVTNFVRDLWRGIGATTAEAVAHIDSLSQTDEPSGERMTRVQINKYLATRSDLLPSCNNCEKKVDMMEFITSNTLRFKCHSAVVDEYVSNDIVRNQDKMYDYLAALPERKVFKLTLQRAALWAEYNYSHWRPQSSAKLGDFAMALADQQVFSAQVSNYVNGVSRHDGVHHVEHASYQLHQPSYHPPAQPKPKQPKLAPLLPTDHVPRAITFDD